MGMHLHTYIGYYVETSEDVDVEMDTLWSRAWDEGSAPSINNRLLYYPCTTDIGCVHLGASGSGVIELEAHPPVPDYVREFAEDNNGVILYGIIQEWR